MIWLPWSSVPIGWHVWTPAGQALTFGGWLPDGRAIIGGAPVPVAHLPGVWASEPAVTILITYLGATLVE